jgi:TolB-like protein/lipoprotein NlpI
MDPMSSEPASDVKFEISHVLFIDIVGYSKLLIHEQSEQLQRLKEIVRGTEQVRLAEAEGKLLRLPTGDGGALVFRTTPEAPVLCALEITKALKSHPELRVRMGIHSGPVNEVADLNEQANIAGAGINIAQRVMDCGDAGHILLSKHVAEDLEHYARWRPYLHELGECEVKHGVVISVVNLYTDDLGNPQQPQKFKKTIPTQPEGKLAGRRLIKPLAPVAAVIALFAFGIFLLFHRSSLPGGNTSEMSSISNKSIAVLPFANLSGNPENAYFAAGIQDEIITRLAKIGQLKVVSCLSRERFKSSPDDLPAIAKQLGVANVLQGSVQRSADAVRVNVQLVKAETDTHLWADTFDRKLTDVFQIESDIARTIAEKLQASLSGSEERAISVKPTANPEAHQLYLQGRYFWNRRTGENLKKALSYFQQATEKDPGYALAYTGIADSCALIPVYGAGAPQDYYPRAKAAAEKALELDDMLGEAHTSLANVLFRYLKFAESAKEFERSIKLNPNYPTAHQWYGRLTLLITGQFDRAIAEVKRAVELDPVSPIIHSDLGTVYMVARQYDEAIEEFRNALGLDPQFYWAHRTLGSALELKGAPGDAVVEYQEALKLSDDPRVLAFVGHAEASIGKQNEAREILAQLTEMVKSRYVSGYGFALIHLALGEKDQALDWLEKDARERSGFEINFIKVDPYLDPLRGDPRFEALVSKVLSGSVEQAPQSSEQP